MTMMGSKLGTKAFGQTQAAPTSQNAAPSTMSAGDMKKLSGDDVGDVLNKVSDPNWVDPSKRTRSVGNDKMDKDAFFKLMLTQMKNQDPMNPMQSHEMAAQLASFTSLEQMQNMNKTLTEISNAQKPTEQFQVLQLLGKSVAGDSSKVFRAKGDKDHDLLFDLPTNAKEVEIKMKNADGEVVKNYKLNNLKMGSNRILWNGTDDKGTVLPEGEYQFSVEAKNEQDKKLAIKTDFEGQITGVNYTKEGPVLMVGNQTVRLRDVKKIVDTQATKAKPEPVTKAESTAVESKAQESKGAPEAQPKSKILDQVGLSSEMMAKISKETQ